MSEYSTNKTIFKDASLLVAALVEMGFPLEEIEQNADAKQLFDYHGKATHYTDAAGDKAEIVIRRQSVNRHLSSGASNDIGFKRQPDGTYAGIISAYDSNFANTAWMGRLTAAYTRKAIIQKATKQGLRVLGSVKVNGKTQFLIAKA
jgi:hypothetical protein